MGVDVNLYAVGDVTDERLSEAKAYMAERFPAPEGSDWPHLDRPEWEEDGRIGWGCFDRYYGPGYERGDWPRIYAMIRALKAALPECTIHYGGDTDDESPEATDDYLAEIWAHWLSSAWNDYRVEIRAWNSQQATR